MSLDSTSDAFSLKELTCHKTPQHCFLTTTYRASHGCEELCGGSGNVHFLTIAARLHDILVLVLHMVTLSLQWREFADERMFTHQWDPHQQ